MVSRPVRPEEGDLTRPGCDWKLLWSLDGEDVGHDFHRALMLPAPVATRICEIRFRTLGLHSRCAH